MNRRRIRIGTALIFIFAVLVPGLILGGLALRTITQEEAALERNFRGTLLSEVLYSRTLLQSELEQIQEELRAALSPELLHASTGPLHPLSRIPFLLSPERVLLLPSDAESSYDVSEGRPANEQAVENRIFIERYRDFFQDRFAIPVFQNIAVAYKETLLENSARAVQEDRSYPPAEPSVARTAPVPSELSAGHEAPETAQPAAEAAAPLKKAAPVPQMRSAEFPEAAPNAGLSPEALLPEQPLQQDSPAAAMELLPEQSRKSREETLRGFRGEQEEREAIDLFTRNETLRSKVYRQAEEEGKEALTRNITQAASGQDEQKAESIFISTPGRFSDIIADRDFGIIPRYVDDDLQYLFWKKEADGLITGCLIDSPVLKDRLAARMPEPSSPVRILALLDETGRPLAVPSEEKARDWRLSFVASEVSELLPHWEVAAYLADPDVIADRAGMIGFVLLVLILALLVLLTSGGFLTLKAVYREMDLAQKKTTFVANVSHELKTPLTSIRMFSEMLLERQNNDTAREKRYLQIINSETVRLTRLINQILDFSRIGKKKYRRQPVEMAGLCREIWNECALGLQRSGFSCSFTAQEESTSCTIDEEAFKQVFLNLISNAEKYSRERREIAVVIGKRKQPRPVFFLRIEDRGIGIPKKHRKKIFQEFYRADDSLSNPVSGSGLGLAIARRIIRDHGGDLTFVPRYGGGSCFLITLPLSCVRETPGNRKNAEAAGTQKENA